MSARPLSIAERRQAEDDLELLTRRIARTDRFLARDDLSGIGRQAARDLRDELAFERDILTLALKTHAETSVRQWHRFDADSLPSQDEMPYNTLRSA
jgi:hypothetical protein